MNAVDTTLYFSLEDSDSVNMNNDINMYIGKIHTIWLKINKNNDSSETPQLDLLLNNIKIKLVSKFYVSEYYFRNMTIMEVSRQNDC